MTDEATENYGEVITVTHAAVIRYNARTAAIIIHRRDDYGRELLPNGYLIGGNMINVPTERM